MNPIPNIKKNEIEIIFDALYQAALERANTWGAETRQNLDRYFLLIKWKKYGIWRVIEISLAGFTETRTIQFSIGAWINDRDTETSRWNTVVVKKILVPKEKTLDIYQLPTLVSTLYDLINLWEEADLTNTGKVV